MNRHATDDLIVRPYAERDREAVRELFVRVNRALAPADMKAVFEDYIVQSIRDELDGIEAHYVVPGGGFWVACRGERIIGMFGLEAHGDGVFELRRMYVDTDLRRQGIARRLLAEAERLAAALGGREIKLSTSELQQAALKLYENAGYHRVGEEVATERTVKTVGAGLRRYSFVKSLPMSQ